MCGKTDWPPEVAGVLDLLESQPPEARMVVGRFFSFFLTGGLDDARGETLHSHMRAWIVRQRRFR